MTAMTLVAALALAAAPPQATQPLTLASDTGVDTVTFQAAPEPTYRGRMSCLLAPSRVFQLDLDRDLDQLTMAQRRELEQLPGVEYLTWTRYSLTVVRGGMFSAVEVGDAVARALDALVTGGTECAEAGGGR